MFALLRNSIGLVTLLFSLLIIPVSTRAAEAPDTLLLTYHFDTVQKNVKTYFQEFDDAERLIVLSINRKSADRIREGTVLVIPDTILPDRLAYAPFPKQVSRIDSISTCLFVSLRLQAFAAFENGRLIRWGPVSTGKELSPTPAGLFFTNWKSRLRVSSIDESWIMPWYFNIENRRGIAFHEYDLPGYPASHGCIRLLREDAHWIWHWAKEWTYDTHSREIVENGTPVIIFGRYNYTDLSPYFYLPAGDEMAALTVNDLAEADKWLDRLLPGAPEKNDQHQPQRLPTSFFLTGHPGNFVPVPCQPGKLFHDSFLRQQIISVDSRW